MFFVVKVTTLLKAYFFPPLAAEEELLYATPVPTATTGRPFQTRTTNRSTKRGLSRSDKISQAAAITAAIFGSLFALYKVSPTNKRNARVLFYKAS